MSSSSSALLHRNKHNWEHHHQMCSRPQRKRRQRRRRSVKTKCSSSSFFFVSEFSEFSPHTIFLVRYWGHCNKTCVCKGTFYLPRSGTTEEKYAISFTQSKLILLFILVTGVPSFENIVVLFYGLCKTKLNSLRGANKPNFFWFSGINIILI